MKKISKRIIRKTLANTYYENSRYSYQHDKLNHRIIRCESWKIGEAACLEPGAWETVYQF